MLREVESRLKDVMHDRGSSDCVDQRMRICIEGVSLNPFKKIRTSPLFLEAVRDFGAAKQRRLSSDGRKVGPGTLNTEHKAKISQARMTEKNARG